MGPLNLDEYFPPKSDATLNPAKGKTYRSYDFM